MTPHLCDGPVRSGATGGPSVEWVWDRSLSSLGSRGPGPSGTGRVIVGAQGSGAAPSHFGRTVTGQGAGRSSYSGGPVRVPLSLFQDGGVGTDLQIRQFLCPGVGHGPGGLPGSQTPEAC